MAGDISCVSGAELVALIPQMRAFARLLCRGRTQADNLAQDALASAWRFRSRFAQETSLKAWAFAILRNQFYSDRSLSWRHCPSDPDEAAGTRLAVSDPAATPQLDDLRRAMLQLADEQREALTLIGAAGLPYAEAAAICGCPIGTIRSRVSRARRRVLAATTRQVRPQRGASSEDVRDQRHA